MKTKQPFKFNPDQLKATGKNGPIDIRQWTPEEKERMNNLKPLRDYNGQVIGKTPDGAA